MSLTTFVELPDVKQYLRLNVTKPWFLVREKIKAPPLTTNYGWTGTAFDYLLRFYVEKLNPFAVKSRWVAEEGLAILEKFPPERTSLKRARLIVNTAKKRYHSYLTNKWQKKPPEELIRATVDLAQLDLVCRIGLLDLRRIQASCTRAPGGLQSKTNLCA
jgi:hypothetical protein